MTGTNTNAPADNASPATSSPARLDVEGYIEQLRASARFLSPEEAVATADEECRQWRGETPLLAEAGAAMMAQGPRYFASLPFTPEQLQAELRRIRDLQRARDEAEAHFRSLSRALSYRQSRLSSWTAQLTETTTAKLASESGERKDALKELSAPLFEVLDRHRPAPAPAWPLATTRPPAPAYRPMPEPIARVGRNPWAPGNRRPRLPGPGPRPGDKKRGDR